MLALPATARTVELAPVGNWTVSYDDGSCAVSRNFGGPDGLVGMELRQIRPGDSFQLIITSNDFSVRSGGSRVSLLPDAPQDGDRFFGLRTSDGIQGVEILGNFKTAADREIAEELKEDDLPVLPLPLADQIAREQAITGFLVSKSFSRDLLLQTGAMDEPMNVMRNCMDELVSSWGIDVVAHQSLARPVHPEDLSEWALQFQRRYPESMLASGRQAIVWARVTVGTDGRGTQCAIQSTMNDTDFNIVACELLLQHGRWMPALDAQSQPIVSYWVGSIVYAIR